MQFHFFDSYGTPYLRISPDTSADNILLAMLEKRTVNIGTRCFEADSGRISFSIAFNVPPPAPESSPVSRSA